MTLISENGDDAIGAAGDGLAERPVWPRNEFSGADVEHDRLRVAGSAIYAESQHLRVN